MKKRAERREAERAREKLIEARERLARLEPGSGPDRPIEVASASLVEPRALSLRCLRCDGELRLDEHLAIQSGDRRLRLTRLVCRACGTRRELYFRLGTTLAS